MIVSFPCIRTRTNSLRNACLVVFLATVIISAGCRSAKHDDLDALLLKAKSEKKAVMLELGAPDCEPCVRMRPVMARLAEDYKGRMEVYFVDVKEIPSAARQYRLRGIPTQIFLDQEGNEFHRHGGYYEYDHIVRILKKEGI